MTSPPIDRGASDYVSGPLLAQGAVVVCAAPLGRAVSDYVNGNAVGAAPLP